ncbi:hypothetical protein HG530_002577 [Fusarium avenaceum]|nr:hypothetical protein DER45DRAFT_569072 [Fusarium avenaceum]KAI6775819.1 hypothetical protein HG530_002577 [Fusarium avenaceum]KIL92065.1 actin cytoskeleton protein [Fusarium avenaceum]
MSEKSTINVKNIASSTSDGEIKDFFSFCGKISDIKVTQEGETKTAEVIFDKETAKKTALLLNNTQLGPNHLEVTSASADHDDDVSPTKNTDRDSDEITQEEKPRARILAEYLAHGYVVGDAAIQRALDLDAVHNVSSRFFSTLQGLDEKYHATDRAKATDESYGITQRANSLWLGLSSYFEKASNTPTGKKIANFYTEGSRQVQEVHAEARRLADLKKEEAGGSAYKAAGLEKVFGKEKAPATEAPEAGKGSLGTSVPAASAETGPSVSAPEGGEKH